MRKLLIVLFLLFLWQSAVYAYYPRDRKEFLHIENLVRIILYAKAAGFTDEQLNDLTLRDGYSTTNVRAIIDMINFIRQEYGFRENEIITQIIENEKPVVDLYEFARRFLYKDDDIKVEEKDKIYTASDVFHDLRRRELTNITSLRDYVRIDHNR